MILTIPFSIDSSAKLFSLSCQIIDGNYDLFSFVKLLSPNATFSGIVK